ncbi:MAG: hypothetical protein JWQ38_236 [Flavipsychrobacter sp.]|nr:hypothetical protein [Flavipsychrobacter sp.]
MKVLWISFNLIGFALIAGGSIYTMDHTSYWPVVLIGMGFLGISYLIRLMVFRKK